MVAEELSSVEVLVRSGHALQEYLHMRGIPASSTPRPVFLRPKRDGTIVTWTVDARIFTVRFAPPDRLEEEMTREDGAATTVGTCPSRWLAPDRSSLIREFPDDRRLTRLGRLLQPRPFLRLLEDCAERSPLGPRDRVRKRRSSFEIASYRPERRAVLRWRLSVVDEESAAKRELFVFARQHDLPVPTPIEWIEDLHRRGLPVPRPIGRPRPDLHLEHAVPGRSLDVPARLDLQEVHRAGALLARLHEESSTEGLPARSVRDLLDAARESIETLREFDPAATEAARRALEDLATRRVALGTEVGIHGDAHCGQFVAGEGGAISLVDFDRAARGPAALDLAGFEAHLVWSRPSEHDAARRALRSGYASVRACPPPEATEHALALCCLARFDQSLRRCRTQWREDARRLLRVARGIGEKAWQR